MKTILYLSSISLLLSSCKTSLEIYDDAYDAAFIPSTETTSDGYQDFIKAGEKGNQVVLEENKPTKLNSTTYNSTDNYSSITNPNTHDCDCINSQIWNNANGTFYYRAFRYAPNTQLKYYYNNFGGNNGCCNDYSYLSGWNSCGYSDGFYSDWGYYNWGYNPFGYSYYNNSYLNSYYGYYPYNSYNYNNNNGGSWYSNNNGGSWFNNNDNSTSGNHHYGHRGAITTESSNTTTYAHTIKGVATNPVLETHDAIGLTRPAVSTSNFVTVGTENSTSTYGSTINSTGTINTSSSSDISTNVSTTNSTTGKIITTNVPASNQFGVSTTYQQGVSRTGNSSGTTNSSYAQPTGPDNNGGTYARYTNSTNTHTSTSENSTTSTSRTGGYENSNSSTNSSSSSNNSNSNSSSYSGHRSTPSTSSGSSSSGSSSTSGGSGTTSSSRR